MGVCVYYRDVWPEDAVSDNSPKRTGQRKGNRHHPIFKRQKKKRPVQNAHRGTLSLVRILFFSFPSGTFDSVRQFDTPSNTPSTAFFLFKISTWLPIPLGQVSLVSSISWSLSALLFCSLRRSIRISFFLSLRGGAKRHSIELNSTPSAIFHLLSSPSLSF